MYSDQNFKGTERFYSKETTISYFSALLADGTQNIANNYSIQSVY